MPVYARCNARQGLVLSLGVLVLALTGCGSFKGMGATVSSVVTPYKIDVVQGNFVSREQIEALQTGMGRQQVKEILGSPLVTSLFHGDRWEYVFTIKRPSAEPQIRKLTVFFKGDALERFEGDEMPSEAEFVASLNSGARKGKVPVLEATEEQLAKYPPRKVEPAKSSATSAPGSTSPGYYPPLESSSR